MRFEDFYCQDMTTSKVTDLSSDDDSEEETMQQDISFQCQQLPTHQGSPPSNPDNH